MSHNENTQLPLGPYRALDLTNENGVLCGRILGDLGADVIKIEKPGGDPARNIGPFYQDIPHSERSLFWFAYNSNKRGITLNLETEKGQDIFKKLVKTSDFVIESFPPGHLDDLGIGYEALSEVNPGIILVSVTPFGQSGPYRDYKSSDIVNMAMGGLMYVTGDSDRPPVRVSVEQSYLHGSAQAAVGALLALHYRASTGMGQRVDTSIQESLPAALNEVLPHWQFAQHIVKRAGSYIFRGQALQRATWTCKDGQVGMRILTGDYAGAITGLVDWMKEEGRAGDLGDVKWDEIDVSRITQEEYDSWEKTFVDFFQQHTKDELYQEALKRRIHLLPVYTVEDLLEDKQLAARNYWTQVEHQELGTTITYPGPFVRFSLVPSNIRRRAPLIGEHNHEVLGEIGISPGELINLKEMDII